MLNLVSLFVGAIALLLAIPAFLPLFGWLNWLVGAMALVGLVIGLLSSSNSGRNLNILVLVIATLRLMLGGGIF